MRLTITEVGRQEIPDSYPYDYDGDIEPTPWEPSEGPEVKARMDERKRAYEAGEWHMIGVRAVAKTLYVDDDGTGVQGPDIESAGIWGVESDAGEEYLDSLYHDELLQLREMLLASGIPLAEIDQHLAHKHEEDK